MNTEITTKALAIETSIRAIAGLISRACQAHDYQEADRLQSAKEVMMKLKDEIEAMSPSGTSFDFLHSSESFDFSDLSV